MHFLNAFCNALVVTGKSVRDVIKEESGLMLNPLFCFQSINHKHFSLKSLLIQTDLFFPFLPMAIMEDCFPLIRMSECFSPVISLTLNPAFNPNSTTNQSRMAVKEPVFKAWFFSLSQDSLSFSTSCRVRYLFSAKVQENCYFFFCFPRKTFASSAFIRSANLFYYSITNHYS